MLCRDRDPVSHAHPQRLREAALLQPQSCLFSHHLGGFVALARRARHQFEPRIVPPIFARGEAEIARVDMQKETQFRRRGPRLCKDRGQVNANAPGREG